MTHDEAVEIIATLPKSKMDAIRLLRNSTNMGLLPAKTYLEQGDLERRLHLDFVKSWDELIQDIDRQIAELKRQRLEYEMQRDEDENFKMEFPNEDTPDYFGR